MFAVPDEANFIKPLSAFTAHFVSASALHRHPMAKMDHCLYLVDGHVAMALAGFERLESCKTLFPPTVAFAPNKTDFIKLRFPPVVEVILAIPLNRNPLAQTIASFLMITGNAAMPLALFETKQRRKAPLPSRVVQLSAHDKFARIQIERVKLMQDS